MPLREARFRASISSSLSRGHFRRATEPRSNRPAKRLDQLTCTTIHGFAQALIKPYPAEADIDPGAEIIDPAEADLAFEERYEAWLRSIFPAQTTTASSQTRARATRSEASKLVGEVAQFLRRNRDARPAGAAGRNERSSNSSRPRTQFANGLDRFGLPGAADRGSLRSVHRALSRCSAAVAAKRQSRATERSSRPSIVRDTRRCFTQRRQKAAAADKRQMAEAAAAAGRSKADGQASLRRCSMDTMRPAMMRSKHCLSAIAAELLARLAAEMDGLMKDWRDYKRAAALLDFDDLLYTARDLLVGHEAGPAGACRQRFRHVLVDEFQDTDPLQIEILWLLCGEACEGSDKDPLAPGTAARRAVPGRRSQAGDLSFPRRRRERLSRRPHRDRRRARLLKITANFRSVEPILTFVNQRFEKVAVGSGRATRFQRALATREATEEALLRSPRSTLTVAEEQADAAMLRDAEADLRRRSLQPAGRQLDGPRSTKQPKHDALPVRRHRAAGAGRNRALAVRRGARRARDSGLDAGRQGLLSPPGNPRSHRPDAHARRRTRHAGARRAAARPSGRPHRGRASRHRRWACRPIRTVRIGCRISICGPMPPHVKHDIARSRSRDPAVAARRARSTTPYMLLADAIAALNVRPQLRQRFKAGAERAIANVDLFLEMARAYDVRGLRAFARDMRANWEEAVRQVEGRPDAEQQSVSLITIHAAKGPGMAGRHPDQHDRRTASRNRRLCRTERRTVFSIPVLGVEPDRLCGPQELERAGACARAGAALVCGDDPRARPSGSAAAFRQASRRMLGPHCRSRAGISSFDLDPAKLGRSANIPPPTALRTRRRERSSRQRQLGSRKPCTRSSGNGRAAAKSRRAHRPHRFRIFESPEEAEEAARNSGARGRRQLDARDYSAQADGGGADRRNLGQRR